MLTKKKTEKEEELSEEQKMDIHIRVIRNYKCEGEKTTETAEELKSLISSFKTELHNLINANSRLKLMPELRKEVYETYIDWITRIQDTLDTLLKIEYEEELKKDKE